MACIHGYAPSECLICRALEPSSGSGTKTTTRGRRKREAGGRRDVEVVRGSRPDQDGGRLFSHVAVLIGLLVLAAISFWVVTSIVYAVLRLLELAIVAGVAGTLGYRIGRARGRRER